MDETMFMVSVIDEMSPKELEAFYDALSKENEEEEKGKARHE